MDPDLKQSVTLPPINWDRVLKWCAITMASVTAISLISRARMLIAVAEFVYVVVVVGLIILGTVALIAKCTSGESSQTEKTDHEVK